MLEPPFDIIGCSWPRPIEQGDNQWASEPEWDAPLMPALPHWEFLNDELCWTINWRNVFRSGLRLWNHGMSGERRGFMWYSSHQSTKTERQYTGMTTATTLGAMAHYFASHLGGREQIAEQQLWNIA